MKIRSGFVSNSSSSSFVLLGIKIEDSNYQQLCENYLDKELLEKEIKEQKESKWYNEKYGVEYSEIWWENNNTIEGFDIIQDDGPTYFGKTLAEGEYDYLENGSISLEEFNEMIEKVKEKFPDKECKIWYGTYAC